jgi:anti-sigma B factor antagonist
MAQFSGETRGDGLCVVRAAGDIDIAAAEEFLEVVRDVLGRCTAVEVDLGDVTFIDSSGLGALVRMRKEAGDKQVSLRLTNVSAATDRLLRLTGLSEFFDIRTGQT